MRLSRKIGINLIIGMLAIENILFLDYKIMGLDVVDIGVLIGFAFLLCATRIEQRIGFRCSKFILLAIGIAAILFCLSWAKGYELRYMLPDMRNFLFMVLVFEIFRSKRVSISYVMSVVPFWGMINSFIAIVSFGLLEQTYTREIYTPLWVSILSMGLILFEQGRRYTAKCYLICLLNFIAIILSQTRSYIIPAIAILIVYMILAVKDRKILKLLIVSIGLFFSILFLKRNDFYDIIVERLTGSFDESSTLWLRMENSLKQLKSMSLDEWFMGKGFGNRFLVTQYDGSFRETSDLEMMVPNQIFKWGIIVFLYVYGGFISKIKKVGLKNKPRSLVTTAFLLFAGGFFSGLQGMIGNIVVGVLLGMFANDNTFDYIPNKVTLVSDGE